MTSALEGGGGSWKSRRSKGGCVKMRKRGEGGQKICKFCGRHQWKAPLGGGRLLKIQPRVSNDVCGRQRSRRRRRRPPVMRAHGHLHHDTFNKTHLRRRRRRRLLLRRRVQGWLGQYLKMRSCELIFLLPFCGTYNYTTDWLC